MPRTQNSGHPLFGSIKQVAASTVSTFSVREFNSAQTTTDNALLSGTYAVQARSSGGSFKSTGVLDAEGSLSVTFDTCTVVAKLSPRPQGNVYNVIASLEPACKLGTGAFSGHAVQALVTRNVYLLLTAPEQTGLMLLLVPDLP